MATTTHRFRFFRAGGFDQVRLDRGEDLLALDALDQKLWVTLSCPVHGTELDEKTLALIDSDNDGRIRAPEVIAAAKWAAQMLRDPNDLLKGGDSVALASIRDDEPEAKKLLASARQILRDLGKKGDKRIALGDVTDTAKIFAQTKLNGDGVVPPSSAEDEATAKVIADVLACVGGERDRSGQDGVSKAKLDAFFEAAAAFDAWWKKAEESAATVLPLGERTADAAKLVAEVAPKIDDYVTRCRLAAFDARATAPLSGGEAEYAALAESLLSPSADAIAKLPLAKVAPGGAIPLEHGVNPAWADRMHALRTDVVAPLLGDRASLTAAEWASLREKLAPFEAWTAAKAGSEVEKLGIARVRELCAGSARADVEALIAADQALEAEANGIAQVEKLVRFQRDLCTFLANFVSFSDFYAKKRKATFQAGTLYLDQRSCELCVRVEDVAKHAAIATLSKTFLAYCECTRKSDGKKMTIAAAFTDGDSDDLMVGRNGIFYDRKGADWDATIVKLIEHPISIRQAFWLPYKRVAKLVGGQIESFASARDKELQDKTAANVQSTAKSAETASAAPAPAPAPAAAPAKPAEQAFDVAKFAGIFAAIGLAIGAIGSALAAVATGFLNLRWWQMPLVVVGAVLLVSGPSMIIAWLKLRERSLGPLLDGNGWAVNARARINIPFGASLTAVAALPKNAERTLDDPYAPPRVRWVRYAVALVLVGLAVFAWHRGYAKTYLGF